MRVHYPPGGRTIGKTRERRGNMAKPQRPGKGESVLCLPRDYTVVDTETTGLSTES